MAKAKLNWKVYITFYNYKGEVVRSVVVSSEGEALLEYGSLPSGVYLIKTVAYTIKIRNNK